ncbi:four helix bundle protein [candidate division WOR-3 bacterium]|nr:four helix bundle protein [candidate division WOR-3 bacterium]
MAKIQKYRGFKDLKVYQLAYKLAMEIFEESKMFPREEKYSLTGQIRRSSRSVPANIAEAWKKRKYKKAFVSKLIDAFGEAGEIEVWLDMSFDAKYLLKDRHKYYLEKYEEVNKMLYSMIENPDKFCSK